MASRVSLASSPKRTVLWAAHHHPPPPLPLNPSQSAQGPGRTDGVEANHTHCPALHCTVVGNPFGRRSSPRGGVTTLGGWGPSLGGYVVPDPHPPYHRTPWHRPPPLAWPWYVVAFRVFYFMMTNRAVQPPPKKKNRTTSPTTTPGLMRGSTRGGCHWSGGWGCPRPQSRRVHGPPPCAEWC